MIIPLLRWWREWREMRRWEWLGMSPERRRILLSESARQSRADGREA